MIDITPSEYSGAFPNNATRSKPIQVQAQTFKYIFTAVAILISITNVCAFSSSYQVQTHITSLHSGRNNLKRVSNPLYIPRRSPIYMTKDGNDDHDRSNANARNNSRRSGKNNNNKRRNRNQRGRPNRNQTGMKQTTTTKSITNTTMDKSREEELLQRISQLESLTASQAVELRKLREDCRELKEAAEAFTEVVNLLRQAGLSSEVQEEAVSKTESSSDNKYKNVSDPAPEEKKEIKTFEAFDDSEIFGTAPSSVTDAADAAGAAILAALLAGKQRMLVDVRDAELSREPDVLVQFIELSILPVAAGLEGLASKKRRVKVVFPTVSMLLQYRRTMALSAPEVISLSTLGFDPVEDEDNLVVIIAPPPDDKEGLAAMNELLFSDSLFQPVVVLNHHMVPLLGPGGDFDPVYHLRLLSVQYMTGNAPPPEWEAKIKEQEEKEERKDSSNEFEISIAECEAECEIDESIAKEETDDKEDAELEAAMEHAHELGVHQGVTRAMVIRAYPKPWHIFVDTSPDSDADFEVAATFDECPTTEEVNYAIVECLEGSEREDELVAQQMQEALESGQLNAVSDMLGLPNIEMREDDEEDDEFDDWDPWGTDTV